ncbi:MAG: TIGR04255 family protein [Candidatus Marinimicrobia bacterium]|nr:TIGR04255 family protein [Candidatus Neomarinimicrobiota bacterium]
MTGSEKNQNVTGALPSYNKPPIVEVVCGMRFQPPDNLFLPHIGILWNKFRADYPNIKHAPPIASSKGEILLDKATGAPLPRVWFINKTDDQLIQFQSDRFYFNWRHRQNEYPRYPHIIKNFEDILKNILEFFKEFNFGDYKPIKNELTYINHISLENGLVSIDDISNIFSDFLWNQSKNRFLPNPNQVSWLSEFTLPEQNGYLSVSLKQAQQIENNIPLIVLEMKAKGIGDSTSIEATRKWFDLAHEWIVRAFTDLTNSDVHNIWERENND